MLSLLQAGDNPYLRLSTRDDDDDDDENCHDFGLGEGEVELVQRTGGSGAKAMESAADAVDLRVAV